MPYRRDDTCMTGRYVMFTKHRPDTMVRPKDRNSVFFVPSHCTRKMANRAPMEEPMVRSESRLPMISSVRPMFLYYMPSIMLTDAMTSPLTNTQNMNFRTLEVKDFRLKINSLTIPKTVSSRKAFI